MALRTAMGFWGIPPETRVKLVILRGTLHKTYAKILEEMVDTLWEAHKDDVAARVSPHKVDDAFLLAMKINEQKAPYNPEGRKPRQKNVRRQDNLTHRRDREFRTEIRRDVPPVPIP